MVFAFPAASLADHLHGEVQEIIIKIETEDGVKWYQVGKDMELINIREGDRVHFDYADDDLEAIVVEPKGAEGEE
jgi:hypothetical protein